MRTWVMASEKGGVGKTTIATNLACYAVQCGERVVIADLDGQGSAPGWYSLRGGDSPTVLPVAPENLQKVKESSVVLGVTLLIVDTRGQLSAATLTAIRAASLVITPVRPSLFDLMALKDTVQLIKQAEKLDAAVCVVNGITPGKAPVQEAAYSEAEIAASSLGVKVAPSPGYLCQRVAYVNAIGAGKGVTEHKPRDPAAQEIRSIWEFLNTLDPLVAEKEKAAS
jgi:chromosome partitioning protein